MLAIFESFLGKCKRKEEERSVRNVRKFSKADKKR